MKKEYEKEKVLAAYDGLCDADIALETSKVNMIELGYYQDYATKLADIQKCIMQIRDEISDHVSNFVD